MGDKKTGMAAWAAAAEGYALPAWEQLPGIPLYMDQVTMVTGEALALFERDEKQSLLTSSMVNNYVKTVLWSTRCTRNTCASTSSS